MKNAYIFHGWQGNSQENWFPWLKDKLEKLNIKTTIPDFPDSDQPKLEKWLKTLENYDFNQETILIGHSLGAALIIRFLEKNKVKIASAYLVAVFDNDLNIPQLKNSGFFSPAFDWQKIKNQAENFYILNSNNDSGIKPEYGLRIAQNLGIKTEILSEFGHFNNFSEFPYLLNLIKKNET